MTGGQACLPGKTISTNVADIKKLKASEDGLKRYLKSTKTEEPLG
jgi:hypothetical protein